MDIQKNIKKILKAEHEDPFGFLGMHAGDGALYVRAYIPDAAEVWLLRSSREKPVCCMAKIHKDGIFEAVLPGETSFRYRYRIILHNGEQKELDDPYALPPMLTDFDLHLIGEGTHYKNYEKLGSHVGELEGLKGVNFAVWAPNAKHVSVVGEFNNWDGRRHPMRSRGSSGIWELFIPGLGEGTVYKYEVKGRNNKFKELKSDPFSFFFEVRPKSATIVYDIENKHKWRDSDWLKRRGRRDWFKSPVSVYEVHLGSWMRVPEEDNRFLTYRELADKLIPYVKSLGFTHIELLPVSEHPFDGSWGYQTIGYFAPTSRSGSPADFMFFVDECHRNDIGVIVDWVPAHFPKDAHGLAYFDGTCLYEHADPRKGEHRDWGTLIFNYGRNEVRNFLISNALFWLDKYHIDGLRVDAVASMLYLDYSREHGQWVPNMYGGNENLEAISFIKLFNEVVHKYHPGVLTIAEESTSFTGVSRPTYLGGLGFSMKWNMGWMHDTISYFSKDPVFRKYHSHDLTFSMLYAFTENFMLPFSHDEVVHGKRSMLDKMPGDLWQKFANMRALLAYMYGHPGKKLLFMGIEIGQWSEWDCSRSLDWHLLEHEPHDKLRRFISDLNALYKSEPAMHEVDYDWTGFDWIDIHDSENSVLSFMRRSSDKKEQLIFVLNLTPVPRYNYRVGVQQYGFYREIMNSDSGHYWGGDMGNAGGVHTEDIPSHGRAQSLCLTLPPLSCLILKPV